MTGRLHNAARTGGTFRAILYNPRVRSGALQVLAIGVVAWLGWEAALNAIANLRAQHLASGFGFLDQTAGFSIVQTLIPYSETSTYARAFVVGLLNTLLVAVTGIVVTTVLGFALGIARLSGNWLIARLAGLYIEIVRNVPLLLQLFFWYTAVLANLPPPRGSYHLGAGVVLNNRGLYVPRPVFGPGWEIAALGALAALAVIAALAVWARRRSHAGRSAAPAWTGVAVVLALCVAAAWQVGLPVTFTVPELAGFNFRGGVQVIPEFVALELALTLYTAAFVAEIVRAGILSVDRGQLEAARSLGLHEGAILRKVVIPQAMRVIIPPLTNQYLNLTKNSSLAVAIAYPDLVAVFAGTVLNNTGRAIEILSMTMGVYLTLSLGTAGLMNLTNTRFALRER